MKITASQLRADVYRLLDQVLETGVPLEIDRGGRTLKVVAAEPVKKLDRLMQRPYLSADPEDLVHLDWSGEWRP